MTCLLDDAPCGPKQHDTKCHAEQRIDREKAGEADDERRYDDQKATDERLDDVPVGAPHVEVPLLSLIEEPKGDQLSDYAASRRDRSEEHTSELQSLMRISYAVFCLQKKTKQKT